MVKRSMCVGLMVATLLCAQVAMAKRFQPSWSVTPSVGFCLFEGGSGIKDRPVYSLGVGLKSDKDWGGEVSLNSIKTKMSAYHRSVDLDIYQATASLVYDLVTLEKLTPYLLVGGGWFYADYDKVGSTSGISLHLGAGFRYRMSENLAFKSEIRQENLFGMPNEKGKKETCNNLTALVGLEFRFPYARRDVVASVPFANMDINAVMAETAKIEKAAPAYPGPVVVVSPRFDAGSDKIQNWAPEDLNSMKSLINEQPTPSVLVISDVDEKGLSFSQFKLQERRALFVRFFLIGHFGLYPQSVQVVSHADLVRFSPKELKNKILIRFIPVENTTELSKASTTRGEAG